MTTEQDKRPGDLAAENFLDHARLWGAFIEPVTAGTEGVVLLSTLFIDEDNECLAKLHKAGSLTFVVVENCEAVCMSLRERGAHDDITENASVRIDGVDHQGLRVIAVSVSLIDPVNLDTVGHDLVCRHEGRPTHDLMKQALDLASTEHPGAEKLIFEARRFIEAEWDRIRGVLPNGPPPVAQPSPLTPAMKAALAIAERDGIVVAGNRRRDDGWERVSAATVRGLVQRGLLAASSTSCHVAGRLPSTDQSKEIPS